MKQTLLYFLVTYLICMTQPCKSQNVLKGNFEGYRVKVTKERDSTAVAIHERQKGCANDPHPYTPLCAWVTSDSCGLGKDYCNIPGCIDKIMCCHQIDTGEFNYLTNNKKECSRAFSRRQISNVLPNSICDNHFIRFYIHNEPSGRVYYRINTSEDTVSSGEEYETFYSVALLSGLYKSGIRSFRLYRGTRIFDNGKAIDIIPIEVFFQDGRVQYYDLSNDFP